MRPLLPSFLSHLHSLRKLQEVELHHSEGLTKKEEVWDSGSWQNWVRDSQDGTEGRSQDDSCVFTPRKQPVQPGREGGGLQGKTIIILLSPSEKLNSVVLKGYGKI